MSQSQPISTDEVLESILRGAAKTLGCNSANLVVFNEFRQQIRIRVGLLLERQNELARLEKFLGEAINDMRFDFDAAKRTELYRAWQQREVTEVASLGALARGAFPKSVLALGDALIGEHQFLNVPVIGPTRCYGVIIFEKAGGQPFSRQQRELLIRYSNRIGEIIENDVRSLRLQEERLGDRQPDRSIQDHLLQIALDKSAPALLLDPGFRVTSCNAATRALLGYEPEELVGQDFGVLFEDRDDVRTILNHQFLFLSDGHHEETAVVRKRDGELMTAKVEALLLAARSNEVIGYLLLVRELEDRPGGEKGREAVGRMMRRERLATMGEIAAQLAHEIRNPILAIGATLESLQGDIEGDHARTIESLAREVKRLDMILRDYLSLSARQNASIRRVAIAEVVGEARDLLTGLQAIAGKEIRVDIPSHLEVQGDFDGLKQVFFNLLLNAMEASPRGAAVCCRAEERDGMVVVHVDDSGRGLDCEPERCLAPFFSTKPNGTGLGLAVCQKILAGHGGSLGLANREGGGCRASVTLPRRAS